MKYTNEEITDRRDHDLPNAQGVQELRAYASGNQKDMLTHQQSTLLGPRSEHAMTDNVLDLILQTASARLRLERWDVNSETPVSIRDGSSVSDSDVHEVKSYLNMLWLLNRMPRLQYEVHYASLRDGNSAVSLAYRGGRVQLAREPWWDGETGMYVAYNTDGTYELAVKEWNQRKRDGTIVKRRTVYEPGLISRWQQAGDGWREYDDDGQPSQVRETRSRGGEAEPMSIPVVHFPNGSGITESDYGMSDISSILALQDDLNATQRDISASAMMTAFQRLFFSGVSQPNKIKMAPGSAAGDENDNARLTVVPSGDVSQLTSVHDYKRHAMALASRTPLHAISGQWPSGAALLRADMPIIEKTESGGDVAGPQWTMVAHRSIERANAYGGLNLNEDVPIMSMFAPAERIDDLTRLEIDQARADLWTTLASLPREAMLQTGLVDEDTANQIVSEREESRMSMLAAFDRGEVGTEDYTGGGDS